MNRPFVDLHEILRAVHYFIAFFFKFFVCSTNMWTIY